MDAAKRRTQDRVHRHGDNEVGLSRLHASKGHESNDAYMERFQAALTHLGNLSLKKESTDLPEPKTNNASERHETKTPPALVLSRTDARHEPVTERTPSASFALSARPLLCSSLNEGGSEIAVGSADHEVYVIDLSTKQLKRTLYTKAHGHTEWVTCVQHTEDGCVVSGGMDSKICLWKRDSAACVDLIGHRGSISGLACHKGTVVSSSYDKSIKLWRGATKRELSTLTGHKAPILHLLPTQSDLIASGDRGGSVFIWDLSTAELIWRLKKIHKGSITSLQWLENESTDPKSFLTGGQDGILRMWDLRDKSNVFKERVHGTESTTAAINAILLDPTHPHLLTTCGADKTIKALPTAQSLERGQHVVCSCGDGTLLFLDPARQEIHSKIETQQAAMRFLHHAHGELICGGDTGNLSFYVMDRQGDDFEGARLRCRRKKR